VRLCQARACTLALSCLWGLGPSGTPLVGFDEGGLPEDLVLRITLVIGHAPVDADEHAGAVELPALLRVLFVLVVCAGKHRDEQVQQHLPVARMRMLRAPDATTSYLASSHNVHGQH
jgi:hypothetical protein